MDVTLSITKSEDAIRPSLRDASHRTVLENSPALSAHFSTGDRIQNRARVCPKS
jgi:hypothetical protein